MKRSLWILSFFAALSLVVAEGPSWWTQRGVINPQATKTADDFAVLNQGQLKNLARAARDELNSKLTGGAGADIEALVNRWQNQQGSADDFAVVTIGQLKNTARLYLQRLHAVGQIAQLPPWTQSSGSDDFSVANIGQAKALFNFTVADSPSNSPTHGTTEQAPSPSQPVTAPSEQGAYVPPSVASSPSDSAIYAPNSFIDSDGDGLPDVDEGASTSVFDWDSNGDNVADSQQSTSGNATYQIRSFTTVVNR